MLQLLSSLPQTKQRAFWKSLKDDERRAIVDERGPLWLATRRGDQTPPDGDWAYWLILAGRGWGKTRTGSEFIVGEMRAGRMTRVALVGRTAADVRDVMIEGPSGIVAVAERYGLQPKYEPSKRRITLPGLGVCIAYTAEEPDLLRGPEHDGFWCDELAAWKTRKAGESKSRGRNRAQETWDNLMFGFRVGQNARGVITTTPRPVPLVRQILADAATHVTRGSTFDNAANLSRRFLAQVKQKYAGTRIGRQELEGEVLDDVEGALWTQGIIDDFRAADLPRTKEGDALLARVVVAIDPAATHGDGSDATGLNVSGRAIEGEFFVLYSQAARLSPDGWANRAIDLYLEHDADAFVLERNTGGDMAEHTLRTALTKRGVVASIVQVYASRGKQTRAEPISALYEQGRVHHVWNPTAGRAMSVNPLASLEAEMIVFPVASEHDDEVDALVWAITELAPETSDSGELWVL